MRKIFARHLRDNYLADGETCILLGDISVGLFLGENDDLVPNAYNMGILEQSMISFAAGLANTTKNVFTHTISPFIIERVYEQIKLDICYNQNKVILVSANGPYEYSKLGPTHHCASDVPLLNLLSKIEIYLPGRDEEVVAAVDQIVSGSAPSYLRLTSEKTNYDLTPNEIYRKTKSLNIFVGETLRHIHNLDGDSYLYIYKIQNLDDYDLSDFTKITVYEPYSVPIIGNHLKLKLNDCDVQLRYYPENMESGVFSTIEYIGK